MLLFWTLIDKIQISKPPEATMHHNSMKSWNLLSIRADSLCILYGDTADQVCKLCFHIKSDHEKRLYNLHCHSIID